MREKIRLIAVILFLTIVVTIYALEVIPNLAKAWPQGIYGKIFVLSPVVVLLFLFIVRFSQSKRMHQTNGALDTRTIRSIKLEFFLLVMIMVHASVTDNYLVRNTFFAVILSTWWYFAIAEFLRIRKAETSR